MQGNVLGIRRKYTGLKDHGHLQPTHTARRKQQASLITASESAKLPAVEAEQGDALPCFSSRTINEHPFHGLFGAMCLVLCFLLISPFKTVLRRSAEVPSGVPECGKAAMHLPEKMPESRG